MEILQNRFFFFHFLKNKSTCGWKNSGTMDDDNGASDRIRQILKIFRRGRGTHVQNKKPPNNEN